MEKATIFGITKDLLRPDDARREVTSDIAQRAWLLGMIRQESLRYMGGIAWAHLRGAIQSLTGITPEKVRLLREQTGEGLMACKKALTAAGGDMEAAKERLRTQGQAVVRRPVQSPSLRVQHVDRVGSIEWPADNPMPDMRQAHRQIRENEDVYQSYLMTGDPVTRDRPSDPFMVIAPRAAMVAQASLMQSAMPALTSIAMTATDVMLARQEAEARIRRAILEAYDRGYSDGQSNPNGHSDESERGRVVVESMA
jgi:hypothetical protein